MVDPHPGDPLVPPPPGQRMQRLRVGVTGLAAILLVVTLATAIASSVRRNAANETAVAVAPPPVVATLPPVSNGVDPNAEPLAQLGAAPGAAAESKGPKNGAGGSRQ